MPILNENNSSVDELERFVNAHKGRIRAFFNATKSQFAILGGQVWSNPKFTPKQIVDQYGTEALELFRLSGLLQAMVEQASGESLAIVPDGYTITPNQDGTVTLVEPEVLPPDPVQPPAFNPNNQGE